LGNRFTLDLELETEFREAMLHDDLKDTVDSATLSQIIKDRMDVKVKLLEHLGHRIISDILEAYPKVPSVRLTLTTHHPALGGIVQYSAVTVCYPEDFS